MLKLYVALVLLGVVFAYRTQFVDVDEPPQIFNEVPCLSFGGICVVKDECPQGALSTVSGLCPVQQRQGVECCHGISQSEKRCRNNGGECMPRTYRCPESLTYTEASDCEADEKCCILVN